MSSHAPSTPSIIEARGMPPCDVLPAFTNIYTKLKDDFTLMYEIGRLYSGCIEQWPRSLTSGSSENRESNVLMGRYILEHGKCDFPGQLSLPPEPEVSVPATPSIPSATHPITWGGNVLFTPPREWSDALHYFSYSTAFKSYEGEDVCMFTDLASASMHVDLAMVPDGTIHPVMHRV